MFPLYEGSNRGEKKSSKQIRPLSLRSRSDSHSALMNETCGNGYGNVRPGETRINLKYMMGKTVFLSRGGLFQGYPSEAFLKIPR